MAKFHVTKGANSQYYWNLRSANGQVIATGGEGFTTKAAAENGIRAVQKDAASATVEDDTNEK